MIVNFERVSTAEIRRDCRRSVDKEKPWRRPDSCAHLATRKFQPVFGVVSFQQSYARVLIYFDVADRAQEIEVREALILDIMGLAGEMKVKLVPAAES